MKKTYQISNIISLLLAIFINYAVGTSLISSTSIGNISDKYENLLTPAGYAFGIWGLIYISLIAFAVYQARDIVKKDNSCDFVLQIKWWFVISNIANASWIFAFSNGMVGLSVVLILLLLFSLLKIVLNLNMEKWDAPIKTIVLLWWPFSIYFGWVTVAVVANISLYLTKIGWDGSPLSPDIWTILVLLIVGAIFIFLIWNRNMREAAITGVWGIIAIAVNNFGNHEMVSYIAIAISVLIVANTAIHAYKNRATSIPEKLKSRK